MHLLQSSTNPPGHGRLSADSSSSPPASSGPVTPAAFNGTWSGQVTSPLTTFSVTISLTTGRATGTMSYTAAGGISCSGGLTVASVSATGMTTKILGAQKGCSTGTVAITLAGTNAINFSLQGTPAATGTLSRQ
jgi:hypothetical protein